MGQQHNPQQLESMFGSFRATEFNKTESTEHGEGSEKILCQQVLDELESEEEYINYTLHRFCELVQSLGIDNIIERLAKIEPNYPLLKDM